MAEQMTNPAPQRQSVWPKDALRITFGVIWLVDAILKWLPGFRADYMSVIMGQTDGQPAWLNGWFHFWINLQHGQVNFFVDVVATVETLIALALIFGFARKLTYLSAAIFSLLIWSTAEGFGGPYTSGSSDVGTALIYAIVFAGLLALNYYVGPSRYSVDYYIEGRFRWWWLLAEMRRPTPSLPTVGSDSDVAPKGALPYTGSASNTRPGGSAVRR